MTPFRTPTLWLMAALFVTVSGCSGEFYDSEPHDKAEHASGEAVAIEHSSGGHDMEAPAPSQHLTSSDNMPAHRPGHYAPAHTAAEATDQAVQKHLLESSVQISTQISNLSKLVTGLSNQVRALDQKVSRLEGRQGVARPAPAPSARAGVRGSINVKGYPALGDANAPVTIVEFSDYQCPFCARHARETLPLIEKDFIHTGKVRYVFMDNPIPTHRYAPAASEAAYCADEQGKYWMMHRHLFTNQRTIRPSVFPQYADAIGLDPVRFGECMASGRMTAKVKESQRRSQAAGARGTPTFLFAKTNISGQLTGTLMEGAKPYSAFVAEFEKLLPH